MDRLDIFMLGYPPHCQILAAEIRKPLTRRPRPESPGRQYAVIGAVCNSTIAAPADL
jgi:hypothetical protein